MTEQVKWPRSFRKATELPADEVAVIVEALITVLDVMGGDIEAEPGTWLENIGQRHRKGGTTEDAEDDDSAEEDDHSGDPLDFGEGPADDVNGFCVSYGFDQARPIGPDNPEAL